MRNHVEIFRNNRLYKNMYELDLPSSRSRTTLTNAVGKIPSRPFNEPISHSLLIRFKSDMRSPATKLKSSAASPEKS